MHIRFPKLSTRKHISLFLLAFCMLFLLTFTGCSVSDIFRPPETISVPDDHDSIQEAINAAEDWDEVIVKPGTYHENIDFKGKNITVTSTDPDKPYIVEDTIIHGNNESSTVTFSSGENRDAVLKGFTITGGSGTWKTGYVESQLHPEEVDEQKVENYFGGGILVANDSSPTIKDNVILDNNCLKKELVNDKEVPEYGQGGAIAIAFNSSPEIKDNRIMDNKAKEGGGIAVSYDSSAVIEGNYIKENISATVNSGAAILVRGAEADITGNRIRHNKTENGPGHAVCLEFSSATISSSSIVNNTPSGIAVIYNSSANIEESMIVNNTRIEEEYLQDTVQGGGIFVSWESSADIIDTTISENKAREGGGILIERASSSTMRNNVIGHNSAEEKGGGILVETESSADIAENTINHNTARLGAGVNISRESSAAVMSNEFEDNKAFDKGGAVWVGEDADLGLEDPDENIYQGNAPGDIYEEP